ncbi:Cyclin-P3-1 [Acorus calamus]|uniref:Cyclin-P3-1 n=1 Tax=Acorus calamus TaxID=4465 RepID=A0AAV9F1E8_ACOCL|nr:Cyclin-P3-1 [Acorus calamus]
MMFSSDDVEYSHAEKAKLLKAMSFLLEVKVDANHMQRPLNPTPSSKKFHGSSPIECSVPFYMDEISKYGKWTHSTYLVSLIYLDRLLDRDPSISLDYLSFHRIMLGCFVLAQKFMGLREESHTNKMYALIGGITNEEMNKIEKDIVFTLDFNLFVDRETFDMYFSVLEGWIMLDETVILVGHLLYLV